MNDVKNLLIIVRGSSIGCAVPFQGHSVFLKPLAGATAYIPVSFFHLEGKMPSINEYYTILLLVPDKFRSYKC